MHDMGLCILCWSSIRVTLQFGSSNVLLTLSIEKLNFQETWNRTLNTKFVDLTAVKTCALISNLSKCQYKDNVQAKIQTKHI